jgi:hypothetical protein
MQTPNAPGFEVQGQDGGQLPPDGQVQPNEITAQQQPQEPGEPPAHFLDQYVDVFGQEMVDSYKERITLDENGSPDLSAMAKMLLESQKEISRLGSEVGDLRKQNINYVNALASNQQAQDGQGQPQNGMPAGGMASQKQTEEIDAILNSIGYNPETHDGYYTKNDIAVLSGLIQYHANKAVENSMQSTHQSEQQVVQERLGTINQLSDFVVKDLLQDQNSGVDIKSINDIKSAINTNPAYASKFVEMAKTGQYSQESIKQIVLDINKDLIDAEAARIRKAMGHVGPSPTQQQQNANLAAGAGVPTEKQPQTPSNDQGGLLDASLYGPQTAKALIQLGLAENKS